MRLLILIVRVLKKCSIFLAHLYLVYVYTSTALSAVAALLFLARRRMIDYLVLLLCLVRKKQNDSGRRKVDQLKGLQPVVRNIKATISDGDTRHQR